MSLVSLQSLGIEVRFLKGVLETGLDPRVLEQLRQAARSKDQQSAAASRASPGTRPISDGASGSAAKPSRLQSGSSAAQIGGGTSAQVQAQHVAQTAPRSVKYPSNVGPRPPQHGLANHSAFADAQKIHIGAGSSPVASLAAGPVRTGRMKEDAFLEIQRREQRHLENLLERSSAPRIQNESLGSRPTGPLQSAAAPTSNPSAAQMKASPTISAAANVASVSRGTQQARPHSSLGRATPSGDGQVGLGAGGGSGGCFEVESLPEARGKDPRSAKAATCGTDNSATGEPAFNLDELAGDFMEELPF